MSDRDSGSSSSAGDFSATACSTDIDLYLHPLLEDPPVRSTASKDTWAEYEQLVFAARDSCSSCPLLADCLYKAVAQTDVSGYVGCTTPKERTAMRKLIGVKVETEDLDSFAGARGSRKPVDPEDVLHMRAQYPDESLEAIAERLDCSLSTVKRHLRKARSASSSSSEPADKRRLPTMDEVFDAFEQVVEVNRARSRAC